MSLINIQKDDLDKPDAVDPGPAFPGYRQRRDEPRQPRLPWQVQLTLAGGALLFVAFVLIVLYRFAAGWAARNPELVELLGYLLWASAMLVVSIGAVGVAQYVRAKIGAVQARAKRELIIRDRADNPVNVEVLTDRAIALAIWQAQFAAAQQAEVLMAPSRQNLFVKTLTGGHTENAAPITIGAMGDEESTPGGAPARDWLRWIDETPHLMIAGRTNAGKTTLASAILAERIQGGDEVLVIDPHDQPDKWYGIQAVGGGRRYDAILTTLDQVVAEMDARYQEYNNGTPTSAFTRLTVLVDEVPAIMDACLNEHRRIVDGRWSQFARKLGSEARKVRISVMLLTQSPLVQDIGLNIQMRKNFSRIALGDETRRLLTEERDGERRKQLEELIRGQAHPAVMEYRGEIHVLNTSDVPALAQQDVRHLVQVWRPSVAAVPVELSQHPTNGRTDGRTRYTQDRIRLYLAALARQGRSRDYARQWAAAHGLRFENSLWTETLDDIRTP